MFLETVRMQQVASLQVLLWCLQEYLELLSRRTGRESHSPSRGWFTMGKREEADSNMEKEDI